MLNVSHKSVQDKIPSEGVKAFEMVKTPLMFQYLSKVIKLLGILLLVVLFLPWTQNIQGSGSVTFFRPEQRPQTIQSPIPGSIREWYVREGDTVQKGDTLAFLSEVKDEYFDPQILTRMSEELEAKKQSLGSYLQKAQALEDQIQALKNVRTVRLQQAKFRLQADSNELAAATTKYQFTEIQFKRADTLYNEGVQSRFDLEKATQAFQEATAKLTSARNKYLNTSADFSGINADFSEKIFKAESDRQTAMSDYFTTQADVAKLTSKISALRVRQSYYYITAPQLGMITRMTRAGIGENIKEGEPVLEIMPLDYQLAVEIFVRPVDLPLIKLGEKGRIEFDGWPAIVFSGWPNVSFGTFGAEVVAINNVLDKNGMYRIMMLADIDDIPWPEQIRFGSGANGILLLKDVRVWYEIWRQLNGFPPEYYTGRDVENDKDELKAKSKKR